MCKDLYSKDKNQKINNSGLEDIKNDRKNIAEEMDNTEKEIEYPSGFIPFYFFGIH